MIKLFLPKIRLSGSRRASQSTVQPKETVKSRIDQQCVEGSEVEGFLVNKVAQILEFGMTMVRLRHVRTGCDYLHLARDDSNNVFSICFRTTPLTSTGVSHVLEHTVLSGSWKYPCKDPFVRMTGRSLATYMNAVTGLDYTVFPFMTQNRTDFKNLLSVYLDAVFKPQLRELDFLQEAWRFEHETPTNRESPIVIKGIVFNEMKGLFSDNNVIFSNALLNNILPSHTYGFISGGDPKIIPRLTYMDLKEFHKTHYHPSNCRMYSYGNFPLVETLRFINKEYLNEYPDVLDYSKSTKVPPEQRWEAQKRKHIPCRPHPHAANPSQQSTIAIASLCNDIRAAQDTFTMQIISELLVNGNRSAFYRPFIESNLGSGFAPMTGYDSHTRDTIFSVGLTSVNPNDFDRIVEIYHQTINKAIDGGFEENNIKAVLHTVELLTRHQTATFGLDMLFQIIPIWNHDGEVSRAIKIGEKVMKFKKSLAENPLHLQDMIHDNLKSNNHRLILTMSPDEYLLARQDDEEKEFVAQRVGALTPTEREALLDQSSEIQRDWDTRQDTRCLPTLNTGALASDVERVTLKGFTVQKVPIQVCNVPSNGISYLRGILNTSILSDEAKNLLPLFCVAVTKMGTSAHDHRQMSQLIQQRTGGFSFGTHIAENIYDVLSFEEGITFSSMCMDRNVKSMMDLWTEIFTRTDFEDMSRFRTIVKETAEGVVHDLTESGDLYAISAASALISPSAERKEQFGGLEFAKTMKRLSSTLNLSEALETMAGIGQVVLKKRLMRIAINTSEETEEKILKSVDSFLKSVPGDFRQSFQITKPPAKDPVNIGLHYEMSLPVSFTAHCFRTVEYTHDDFPLLRLAARLLTSKYLFPNVREKGGAYGCCANISTSGVLSMSSFRDPRPGKTFENFKKAKSWMTSGDSYTSNDIEEAKLGVFQSLDSPVPVGSKGIRNFLFGISDDELQRHRMAIKKATKEDVMRVAEYIDTNFQARCLIGPSIPEVTCKEDNWLKRLSN